MLPSFWPGDIVIIHQSSGDELRVGEVALYAREGIFVIHRVVGKEAGYLITRGDTVSVDDQPVPAAEVLGKVVAIERCWTHIAPGLTPSRAQKFFNFLLRRCKGAGWLARALFKVRSRINFPSKMDIL
jgi:signal peptidase I